MLCGVTIDHCQFNEGCEVHFEQVKEAADYVNESRRDSENLSLVLNIQKQLVTESKVSFSTFTHVKTDICRIRGD